MLGKLKKHDKGYSLIVDNVEIAIYDIERTERPLYSLSKKNCDEIFGVIDIEDLSKQAFPLDYNLQTEEQNYFERMAWKIGFQKALELIGNKKFSEHHTRLMLVDMARFVSTKEMRDAWDFDIQKFHRDRDFFIDKQIQSLQKTEWLVEIDMEWNPISERCDECGNGGKYMETPCDHPNDCKHWSPKIGENRCLILKSVNV